MKRAASTLLCFAACVLAMPAAAQGGGDVVEKVVAAIQSNNGSAIDAMGANITLLTPKVRHIGSTEMLSTLDGCELKRVEPGSSGSTLAGSLFFQCSDLSVPAGSCLTNEFRMNVIVSPSGSLALHLGQRRRIDEGDCPMPRPEGPPTLAPNPTNGPKAS